MSLFSAAEALLGYDEYTNEAEITAFIFNSLGDTITPISVYWSGYFAAAALKQAGLSYPQGYAYSQSWLTFGTTIAAAQVNCIVVWPASSLGYGKIGIVTSLDGSGVPTILVGNYNEDVVEQPLDTTGAVFIALPSADVSSSGTGAIPTTPTANLSPTAAAASSSAAARAGKQTGNVDTPEKLAAIDKSGPMPCGRKHPDVTGTSGAYKATTQYSPVSRLPTHEPFTGHPVSQKGGAASASDSATGATSSGGGSGDGTTTSTGSYPKGTGAAGSVNTTGVPAPVSQKQAASIVQLHDLFKSLNVPETGITALIGTLMAESNLKTGSQNNSSTDKGGALNSTDGGSGAFGIASWNGPRQAALLKSQGAAATTLLGQGKFVLEEMKKSYPQAYAAVMSGASVASIIDTVVRKYEVPKNPGPEIQRAINNGASAVKTIATAAAVAAGKSTTPASTTPVVTPATVAGQKTAAQTAATKATTTAANAKATAVQVTPGSGGGQSPTVVEAATISANHYQPGAPGSKSPDQGKDLSGQNGTTAQDAAPSSGSKSGSSSSGASGGDSDSGGSTDKGSGSTPSTGGVAGGVSVASSQTAKVGGGPVDGSGGGGDAATTESQPLTLTVHAPASN